MKLAPLPPPYYTNEKKKNTSLKIFLFLIVILSASLIIYFTFFRKKTNKNKTQEEVKIIKDASELKKEINSKEEIKIPTIEKNNSNKGEKKETESPNTYLANSNTELLSKEFLYKTEISKIKLIRDEIYARHGCIFKDSKTQKYFESKTWYIKNPKYSDVLLNEVELKNIEIISDFLNEGKEVEKIDKE